MEKQNFISEDNPISKTEDDCLNYTHFANNIYNLISNISKKKNTTNSTIIDISGDYGVGKTSIINLLKNINVKNDNKNIIFIDTFSVFKYTKNPIEEDFIDFLYSEIVEKKESDFDFIAENFIDKILLFKKYFFLTSFLLIFIIIFFRKTLITKDTLEIITNIVTIITAGIAIPKIMNINKTKENIINKIKNFDKKEKTYIIVLDDFDRADKEEICKLISLIKGNLDFPNFVYIFLYDRNRINLILNEKYKSHNFLEKIVNMQLDIPKIDSKNLNSFLYQNNNYFDEGEFEIILNNYNNLYNMQKYFTNLREIKRFINQLNINYLMLLNTEIDKIDFFFIEFIKYFEPEVYKLIKENHDIYLTKEEINKINQYNYNKNNKEEDSASLISIQRTKFNSIAEQIINKTKKEDKSIIANLIYNLFSIDNLKGNNNKISSNLSCYKYFQLDINPLEFTKNDIEYFKQYFNDLKSFKKEFLKEANNKITRYNNLKFKFFNNISIQDIKDYFNLALEKYYFNNFKDNLYFIDNKYKTIYDYDYNENIINILIFLDSKSNNTDYTLLKKFIYCQNNQLEKIVRFFEIIKDEMYKTYFISKFITLSLNESKKNNNKKELNKIKTEIIWFLDSININDYLKEEYDDINNYDIIKKDYYFLYSILDSIKTSLQSSLIKNIYDDNLQNSLLNFLRRNIDQLDFKNKDTISFKLPKIENDNFNNKELSKIDFNQIPKSTIYNEISEDFNKIIDILININENITNECQKLKDKIKEKGF